MHVRVIVGLLDQQSALLYSLCVLLQGREILNLVTTWLQGMVVLPVNIVIKATKKAMEG